MSRGEEGGGGVTLDELKRLCAEATEGPWEIVFRSTQFGLCTIGTPMGDVASQDPKGKYHGVYENDAAFIAAARTAMPLLIAVAEAAKRCFVPHNHASMFCTQCFTDMRAKDDVLAALRALEGKGE